MKRVLSLLLCAAFLAGCSRLNLMPPKASEESGENKDAASPAPTHLSVCLAEEDEPLKVLFDAYGAERNVEVEYSAAAKDCDLAVLRRLPGEEWAGLENEPLYTALCRMLGADPAGRGLPLGQYGYGYLINAPLLAALLGEGGIEDLQKATHAEWEAFCQALAAWIEKPSARTVALGGESYTLPAEKAEAAQALSAVFVLADAEADCYGGEALSYALAPAAGDGEALTGLSADGLSGAAGALYDAFCLEQKYLYRPGEEQKALGRAEAEEAFLEGRALFYRADTLRGAVLGGEGMSLGLMSLKLGLDAADIQGEERSAEDLRDWVVMGPYRYLALRPGGDEAEAQAFLYWLYSSHQGQRLLTDTLGLVQEGLRSPSGEPGRSLAAWREAGETLPAFSGALSDEALGGAAALLADPALLDGKNKAAYVGSLCDLLCPAG